MPPTFTPQRWLRSLPRVSSAWVLRLTRLLTPKRLAMVEAVVIGLVAGLAAVGLKLGAGLLGGWRVRLSHAGPAWYWLPLLGILAGLVVGWLIERWAPAAVGSGIPQVKTALARVPTELTWRVGVVKLVSTMLILGAGVPLGRQGPTVQVGAAIAAQLSRWVPISPDYRRQLIAAGAAAGLAAGFNAPIAGVLFVVEELLQSLSGLTLGTAIIASFIGAVVSRVLGGQGLNFSTSLMADQAGISLGEIPLLLVLGAIAGALGGLFSQGLVASTVFYRQRVPLRLPWRLVLVGGVTGLLVALLPAPFRDNSGLQGILLSGRSGLGQTAIAFGAQFGLTLLAYGAGTPGGIFAPSLLLGSAVGEMLVLGVGALHHLSGQWGGWFDLWLPVITSPSTYILAGMAAFFGAVTKGPMTAIVILFEMTGDFQLVLPLMVTTITAYGIANAISPGSIYTRLLALSGIHLDTPTTLPTLWQTLSAAEVMQPNVETLAAEMDLATAQQIFARSHHRGFPVISQGKLVGILSQSDFANLDPIAGDPRCVADVMTSQPVSVAPDETLATVLHLLNRYQISRLPVTEGSRLVGIITRADIIRAESRQIDDSAAIKRRKPTFTPSYCVYQTRSPNTGRGRILVPLANPQNAPTLLQIAGAIARGLNYELECLHIIPISRDLAPSETAVRTEYSRRLLKKATRLADDWNIPIHTQIRVTHDVASTILEVIQERHINLTLVGWRSPARTPDQVVNQVFNDTIDTLIRLAPCDLMVVKPGQTLDRFSQRYPSLFARLAMNRWLVPTAGGPNTRKALDWLPAMITLSSTPEIRLCQISAPGHASPPEPNLQSGSPQREFQWDPQSTAQSTGQLTGQWDDAAPSGLAPPLSPVLLEGRQTLEERVSCPVLAISVCSSSVAEAIVDLADKDQCDVVVLGASRDSLLQQVVKGNVPEAIARRSRCTVILVRGAS